MPVTFQKAGGLTRVATVLPPEVKAKVDQLRNLLYASAQRDQAGVCQFWKDPDDVFYAHGKEVECRRRHVRDTYPEFRQGIDYVFGDLRFHNQQTIADQLVEPLIKMIMTESLLYEPEVRAIVYDHYQKAFGRQPTVTHPDRKPLPPLIPLPGPSDDGGAPGGGFVPGDGGGVPDDGTVGDGGAPAESPTPSGSGEFPWMWVGVGAGALVLIGGGYYLATRK